MWRLASRETRQYVVQRIMEAIRYLKSIAEETRYPSDAMLDGFRKMT